MAYPKLYSKNSQSQLPTLTTRASSQYAPTSAAATIMSLSYNFAFGSVSTCSGQPTSGDNGNVVQVVETRGQTGRFLIEIEDLLIPIWDFGWSAAFVRCENSIYSFLQSFNKVFTPQRTTCVRALPNRFGVGFCSWFVKIFLPRFEVPLLAP